MKLRAAKVMKRTKTKYFPKGNSMGCVDRDKSENVEMLKISTFDPISNLGDIVYQTFLFRNPLSDIA
jgi:hypothetical protein